MTPEEPTRTPGDANSAARRAVRRWCAGMIEFGPGFASPTRGRSLPVEGSVRPRTMVWGYLARHHLILWLLGRQPRRLAVWTPRWFVSLTVEVRYAPRSVSRSRPGAARSGAVAVDSRST
jgi:hypothetical protein